MVIGAALAAGAGEAREDGPLLLLVEFNQLNFLDMLKARYRLFVLGRGVALWMVV